ncbi:TetR/AcrR family transcriptional regulator [Odoribacter splanchnicus]|uniref:TetR/AcrR family transcriptional regulator n=1 Tax=Odoribacter splanchnicus TaxID=28118 RepID=UPI001E2EAE62|nr:TetR/AcrR family transcriptional regulator [Odoribacter splanchnicus]
MQAAEEEFLLKGLEGARTTAIAERAGVTHAMLHYYFRTKNMLFERIIEEKMRNAGNIMQAVFVLGDMPLMERVKRGVEQHFDFIAANPNLPRFVIQEIYSHPERHEIMRSQVLTITKDWLCDLQRHIDESAATKATEWIDARMLLLDIVSLNLFAFIGYPFVSLMFDGLVTDKKVFFEKRKAENVELIMRRLKKMEP